MKLSVAVACLLLLAQSAKGGIEGVVTRAGTDVPIPGARVSLGYTTESAVSSLSVVADGSGRFAFRDLNPGSYHVSAAANGYAKQEFGQKTPGGTGKPIDLKSGQTIKDVAIALPPAGNISGRVRDNSGQPSVGTQVQVLIASYNASGQRSFQSGGVARTDDRGEYRVFWITPGRYYVLAATTTTIFAGVNPGSPNEVPGDVVPPTYFPGVTDIAQASVVDVKPGAEIGGVDIFVNRQAGYRVRGRVVGSNGAVPPSVTISMSVTAAGGTISNTNVNAGYNAQDGVFDFRDVRAGPHILRAQSMAFSSTVTPGTAGMVSAVAAATVSLNVISDMDGVELSLATPVSISGHITMEGPMPAGSPGLNLFRVQLRPSMDGVITTSLGGPTPSSQYSMMDGTFRVDTVLPGEYRVSVANLPADVYVKQVRFSQSDVLNTPMVFAATDTGMLDVVLSSRAGQVDGTVTDEAQRPVPGIQAVLIPDRQRDRVDLYKTATSDANGRYAMRGVTPGDYRVFAWEAIDAFAYYDAELLKQYEVKGKAVHVAESAKEVVDVRVIPAEP